MRRKHPLDTVILGLQFILAGIAVGLLAKVLTLLAPSPMQEVPMHIPLGISEEHWSDPTWRHPPDGGELLKTDEGLWLIQPVRSEWQ